MNGSVEDNTSAGDVALLGSVCGIATIVVMAVFTVLICGRCLVVWRQYRKRRRRASYMLVNDDASSFYSSLTHSGRALLPQPTTVDTYRGKPPVFILYGLELQNFSSPDSPAPAYALLLEFIFFLNVIGIACYHDAFQPFSSSDPLTFSNKVECALQEARVIIVVCSEVLHIAFTSPDLVQWVHMHYGQFNTKRVRKLLSSTPNKVVPVVLAGEAPWNKELSAQGRFCLQGFQLFMESVREGESTSERVSQEMEKQGLTELQDFVQHTKDLLGMT